MQEGPELVPGAPLPVSMSCHLPCALPLSPGHGFSLCQRSLQPPVPALRQPAAGAGLLLLGARAQPLPPGARGPLPAPVARSRLELRPPGVSPRGLSPPQAAGPRLLPATGKVSIPSSERAVLGTHRGAAQGEKALVGWGCPWLQSVLPCLL